MCAIASRACIGVSLVAVLAVLASVAPARAMPVEMTSMGSHPLNISANAYMQWDARFDGAPASEFDWTTAWGGPSPLITTWLSRDPLVLACQWVAGHNGTALTGLHLTGSGTPGDPFRFTSIYECLPFDVTEVISYESGATHVDAEWIFHRVSADGTGEYRFDVAANLMHVSTTLGQGFIRDTPPQRAVGGMNDSVGSSVVAFEDPSTPWSVVEEGVPSHIQGDLFMGPWDSIFHNQVQTGIHDDAIAVEFTGTLPLGATATHRLTWDFVGYDGLVFNSPDQPVGAGDVANVAVESRNRDVPNRETAIRWSVSGANDAGGVVRTSEQGTAQISWSGPYGGVDTLTAYVDTDDDDVLDANETRRSVDVTRDGPPRPAPQPLPAVQPLVPLRTQAAPSNLFSFGRTAIDRRRGSATVAVHVPGPGVLAAVVTARPPVAGHSARLLRVARVVARPAKPGRVRFVIRPRAAAMKVLRRQHRLRTSMRVTYTPTGGTSRVKVHPLTLRLSRR